LSRPDLVADIALIPAHRRFGRITGVMGMLLEAGGLPRRLGVGEQCAVLVQDGRRLACEVVGFRAGRALLMPFGDVGGVGLGCKVELADRPPAIRPSDGWLGRVVNAAGEPIDGKGPLPLGPVAYALRNRPPPAHERRRAAADAAPGRLPHACTR
jgi:flagellum-specific ATP synthase